MDFGVIPLNVVGMPAGGARPGVAAENPARVDGADDDPIAGGGDLDLDFVGVRPALLCGDFHLIAAGGFGINVSVYPFDFDHLVSGQFAAPVKLASLVPILSPGNGRKQAQHQRDEKRQAAASHIHKKSPHFRFETVKKASRGTTDWPRIRIRELGSGGSRKNGAIDLAALPAYWFQASTRRVIGREPCRNALI